MMELLIAKAIIEKKSREFNPNFDRNNLRK